VSVDVAISGDRRVIKTAAEKILECRLTTEIPRMWNIKMKVVPVIRGKIGTISKSFKKHLNSAPGEHKIKELHKISHIGHCTPTAESKGEKKLSHYRSGQALRDPGK